MYIGYIRYIVYIVYIGYVVYIGYIGYIGKTFLISTVPFFGFSVTTRQRPTPTGPYRREDNVRDEG